MDPCIIARVNRLDTPPPGSPGYLTSLLSASTAEQLRNMIYYDPVLAALILRSANSTPYGSRESVCNLSEAVSLIGVERVKALCVKMFLCSSLSAEETMKRTERERLWKNAYATGILASRMVIHRPWLSKEQAYLLGLLHDFGLIVRAFIDRKTYRSAMNLAAQRNVPEWVFESQVGIPHTRIGGMISTRWGLPKVLREVMEFHHDPVRSRDSRPEVMLIALASVLANSSKFSDYVNDDLALEWRRRLYFTEEEWGRICSELAEVWYRVDLFWNLLNPGEVPNEEQVSGWDPATLPWAE